MWSYREEMTGLHFRLSGWQPLPQHSSGTQLFFVTHMWSSPLQEAFVSVMITKAHYEKVKTLAASRCQIANDPTKMKSEPGLNHLTASADAIGPGSLGATGGDAPEATTAPPEWYRLCVAATLSSQPHTHTGSCSSPQGLQRLKPHIRSLLSLKHCCFVFIKLSTAISE